MKTKLIILLIVDLFMIGCTQSQNYLDFQVYHIKTAKKIEGYYMKPLCIAMNNFIKIDSLSKEEKLLKYYTINFAENNKYYIVAFVGKILSKKEMKKYHTIYIGQGVQYHINKKDLTITQRLFSK